MSYPTVASPVNSVAVDILDSSLNQTNDSSSVISVSDLATSLDHLSVVQTPRKKPVIQTTLETINLIPDNGQVGFGQSSVSSVSELSSSGSSLAFQTALSIPESSFFAGSNTESTNQNNDTSLATTISQNTSEFDEKSYVSLCLRRHSSPSSIKKLRYNVLESIRLNQDVVRSQSMYKTKSSSSQMNHIVDDTIYQHSSIKKSKSDSSVHSKGYYKEMAFERKRQQLLYEDVFQTVGPNNFIVFPAKLDKPSETKYTNSYEEDDDMSCYSNDEYSFYYDDDNDSDCFSSSDSCVNFHIGVLPNTKEKAKSKVHTKFKVLSKQWVESIKGLGYEHLGNSLKKAATQGTNKSTSKDGDKSYDIKAIFKKRSRGFVVMARKKYSFTGIVGSVSDLPKSLTGKGRKSNELANNKVEATIKNFFHKKIKIGRPRIPFLRVPFYENHPVNCHRFGLNQQFYLLPNGDFVDLSKVKIAGTEDMVLHSILAAYEKVAYDKNIILSPNDVAARFDNCPTVLEELLETSKDDLSVMEYSVLASLVAMQRIYGSSCFKTFDLKMYSPKPKKSTIPEIQMQMNLQKHVSIQISKISQVYRNLVKLYGIERVLNGDFPSTTSWEVAEIIVRSGKKINHKK